MWGDAEYLVPDMVGVYNLVVVHSESSQQQASFHDNLVQASLLQR